MVVLVYNLAILLMYSSYSGVTSELSCCVLSDHQLSSTAELYGLMLGNSRPLVAFHWAKRSSFFFDGNFLSPFCRFYTINFLRRLFVEKSHRPTHASDGSFPPQSPAYECHSSLCSPLLYLYSIELGCCGSPRSVPQGRDIDLKHQRPHQK